VNPYLKFVTADIGAYGKKTNGDIFQYSALYHSFVIHSIKLLEDTIVPHTAITLPPVFINVEAYDESMQQDI